MTYFTVATVMFVQGIATPQGRILLRHRSAVGLLGGTRYGSQQSEPGGAGTGLLRVVSHDSAHRHHSRSGWNV